MPCDTRNIWAAMIPPSSLAGGEGEHSPNSVQIQYLMCLPSLPRRLRKLSSLLAQCLPRQWIYVMGQELELEDLRVGSGWTSEL